MEPVQETENAAEHEKASDDAQPNMRLADFIHENTEQIVGEWEDFARTLTFSDSDKTPLVLRDHIQGILSFIVSDIQSPQTSLEQIQKSQGGKEKHPFTTAAETHAALRLSHTHLGGVVRR